MFYFQVNTCLSSRVSPNATLHRNLQTSFPLYSSKPVGFSNRFFHALSFPDHLLRLCTCNLCAFSTHLLTSNCSKIDLFCRIFSFTIPEMFLYSRETSRNPFFSLHLIRKFMPFCQIDFCVHFLYYVHRAQNQRTVLHRREKFEREVLTND